MIRPFSSPSLRRFPPVPPAVFAALLLFAACSDVTLLSFDNPLANAGPDRKASLGSPVVMDGRNSRDPQGDPLRYSWTFFRRPAGSTAEFDNASSATPRFTADRAGEYRVRLVVEDNSTNRSAADEAILTALSGASALPDTGQEKCYALSDEILFPAAGAPFDGQDGQYVTNPMALSDNGVVVHDDVTGLDWQKGDDTAAYSWSGAADVCGGLSLGGRTDWRLPTRRELVSILNLGGIPPAADNVRFPGVAPVRYWSSSESAEGVSPFPTAWAVDFDNGVVANVLKTTGCRVRCVRGEDRRSVFVDNFDGTVTDCTTKLVWRQDQGSARSWESALAYCEGLIQGGSGEWRLPNVKELESLVRIGADNSTGSAPTIDTAFFPAAQSGWYWSSTSRARGTVADNAWAVDFGSGKVDHGEGKKDSSSHPVRCVR